MRGGDSTGRSVPIGHDTIAIDTVEAGRFAL
jgi:hypothetical protein